MENEQEIIDSTTDTDVITEEIDSSLDTEAQLNALKEQNKKLFERAKKAEGKLKSKPTIINEEVSIKPRDILRGEEFKLYREGYEEDEIDLIINNGGRKILEDKNNPITLGLERKREQREAEKASQQTSNNGFIAGGSKVTLEQLQNMTPEEMTKHLPHA